MERYSIKYGIKNDLDQWYNGNTQTWGEEKAAQVWQSVLELPAVISTVCGSARRHDTRHSITYTIEPWGANMGEVVQTWEGME